jgi:hypothetical protein
MIFAKDDRLGILGKASLSAEWRPLLSTSTAFIPSAAEAVASSTRRSPTNQQSSDRTRRASVHSRKASGCGFVVPWLTAGTATSMNSPMPHLSRIGSSGKSDSIAQRDGVQCRRAHAVRERNREMQSRHLEI